MADFGLVDSLKAGGASAVLISLGAIAYKLIKAFCGHRVRSECCGHEGTVGVKVEPMRSQRRTPRNSIEQKQVSPKLSPSATAPVDIDVPKFTLEAPAPSTDSTS